MLNSKIFGFQFFLGGREKVTSLYEGAMKNNGATKYEYGIMSNIPTDDFIRTSENNIVSIFVPSTIDVNKEVDNTEYVRTVIRMLRKRYSLDTLSFYNTEGSWLDTDNNEVVIEKITIVSLNLASMSEEDVKYFINIAEYLKDTMNQQAVSININECLAIV